MIPISADAVIPYELVEEPLHAEFEVTQDSAEAELEEPVINIAQHEESLTNVEAEFT